MKDGIFIEGQDGKLVRMTEAPYESELIFQELLASYPELLGSDDHAEGGVTRWLLIKREVGVPDSDTAGERWSLDHLFVDREGIPTFVEVKRSTDTRIRREVIGQILEYGANAVSYWSVEELIAKFETRCQAEDKDADEELANVIGDEKSPEEFWTSVKTNLQAGRVRLIIVADVIPATTRRIIEFLNEQMDPAECLGVEIKRYGGGGFSSLVPRTIGGSRKQPRGPRIGLEWDETTFFQYMDEHADPEVVKVARRIFEWSKAHATYIWFGRGETPGFIPVFRHDGKKIRLGEVWGHGTFETWFQHHAKTEPYASIESRQELMDKYNEITGVNLTSDGLTRRPVFDLKCVAPESEWKKLEAIFESMERKFRHWAQLP